MSKPKSVVASLKLIVGAGQAKPAPPVGPALGQAGVNIMQFCKAFNARTANVKDGTPMRVSLKAYADKSFDYDVKMPTTTYFVKQALGVKKLAGRPGHETAGELPVKHVYEIAKVKHQDMPHISEYAMARQVVSACRSMGVKVVRE